MTIRDKILNYFHGNSSLKLLFVFDPMLFLQTEVSSVEWPAGYRYVEFDGRWFYVKYMLTHDWKEDKVILLIPGEQEPANQSARLAFPLYGEMVANMVFSEETFQSFMQLKGIPSDFAPFIEKHVAELQLSKVEKILGEYYKPGMLSIDVLQRGLLTSYLGGNKLLGWEDILVRVVCINGNESDKSKLESFNKSIKSQLDLQRVLSDKFEELSGIKYDYGKPVSIKQIVESYKYNAITQSLTVIPADEYRAYKIKSASSLQKLNSFVQFALYSPLSDKFNAAVKRLGADVKEEKIISWYGTDAEYALVTEDLCRPILETIVAAQIVSDPSGSNDRLRKLSLKLPPDSKLQQVIAYLSYVCMAYEKIQNFGTYKLKSATEYIYKYRSEFYLIDMHYRKSLESFGEISSALPIYESVHALKKNFDADYAKAVGEFNIEWLKCVNETGVGLGKMEGIRHQQNFYSDNVQGAATKMVVIISDALRYEVAAELMQELGDEKHIARLDCAMAMLPTETKYCKNAMLPQNNLKLCGDEMWVNGRPIVGMDDRTRQLQFYAEDGLCISYTDLMAKSLTERREITKRSIVYVYHDTIDSMSHDNPRKMALACRTAVDELADLIKHLHASLNVTNVILTSDHGFLYNDMPFAEKDKHHVEEETIETKSRYFLTRSSAQASAPSFGISKFVLNSVSGMDDDDVYIAVPNGSNRFYAPGGYEFAHGGATLQELIIPVIYSYIQRVDKKQKVSVKLLEPELNMVSSILKFTLIQAEAVSADIRERKVACGVYLGDALVTKEKEIVLGSADAVNFNNRVYQMTLPLETSTTAPLLELRVYDVDDRLNALIKQPVKNRTFIQQDF